MKVTDPEIFTARTNLVPEIIAVTVLERKEHTLDDVNIRWFISFVSQWLRYYHATSPEWKRKLESKSGKGRDEAYMWIGHWADSMILNPKRFRSRHFEGELDQ